MMLEALSRRKVPIGVGLLLLVAWLCSGLRRISEESGAAVLDSPLGLMTPRPIDTGWHLAPPGLARVTYYPVHSTTLEFEVGSPSSPLASREGTDLIATGTLRYKVDPDRLMDVHRLLGPRYETRSIRPWIVEDLRAVVGSASYGDISGARTEELREALARQLGERFRASGLVLLSCDVTGLEIRSEPPEAAGAVSRPTGIKVLLIGLDGADWNIIDPLLRAGRLPNLARLIQTGVRGRLRTITPMLSPVVWTSIATGVLPARHGIIDFLATTGRDGERIPVTSNLRKVKALWSILSERERTVGVVGWWATYPAERVNGFIVSDRIAYQLFGVRQAADQPREGKVFPADLDGLVASLTVAPETVGVADVSRYIRMPTDALLLPADQNKLIDDFKTLLASGDTYARIGRTLETRFRPEFLGVYLEGTDTVAHLFMPYTSPPLPGIDPDAAQRFGRAVDEYYRHTDEMIGELVSAADPHTAVIVCSDHGFRTGENRPLTESRIGLGQAADWHRKYGIVILSGDGFRKKHDLDEASVLDVAPTILALLGLPAAEDMDGRPILDAFDPEFLKAHPVRYIKSYEGNLGRGENAVPLHGATRAAGAGDSKIPTDPAGDKELKERLRSLGYLHQDTANSHNNSGMILLAQGKIDESIQEFEKAIGSSEDLGIASLNLARAYYKKKEFQKAIESVRRLMERQPRSKDAETLLGNIDMEQGRMQQAEMHFKKALEYEPNFTDARNSLGILYDRQGKHDDAIREFRMVISVDKDYAEAYNNLGVIYKNQGKTQAAIDTFRQAIAADADFAGSYSNLALIYEDQGKAQEADEQFRRALERDPHNAAVRTNYGALLYTLGRFDRAREQLEAAIAFDPVYASAHNNLGAVYGRLGRVDDEIAAYRKASALDPGYADVHHNLGLALLKKGAMQEGEAELRRALAINPRYAPAYFNLAGSLLERNQVAEAKALLDRGAREIPADPDIARLLGEILLRGGDSAGAIDAFRRSLALKPDQPDLRRRLEGITPPGPGGTPASGSDAGHGSR